MKITIQKIRELCTTQSFSRGEEYHSDGLVRNLQFLFMQRMEWSDYDKLKKACTEDEWEDVFSSLVASIQKARGRQISAVDLEKEFEELVEDLRVRYARRPAFLDEIKWL